jgi:hypothetical protein
MKRRVAEAVDVHACHSGKVEYTTDNSPTQAQLRPAHVVNSEKPYGVSYS